MYRLSFDKVSRQFVQAQVVYLYRLMGRAQETRDREKGEREGGREAGRECE